jgi:hypothetical protein
VSRPRSNPPRRGGRTEPSPRRGAPRPARPRRAGPTRAAALAAALALGLAIAAGTLLARRTRPPTERARQASPADTLDLRAAYREGARLYEAGRALEAVPYFRRVGALLDRPQRDYHLQAAQVLERAALQARRDAAQPATRSSLERVALAREALFHLTRAEGLSATPRALAEVRAWRANLLRVWGFPWEALHGLRAAAAADPSWGLVAEAGDLFAYRMHHPDRRVPGLDTLVILRDAP